MQKNVFNTSMRSEPITLDPRKNGGNIYSIILFLLFNGLTKLKKDGSISLSLAKDYKISKDNKQYIFYLKDNIKWSDGKKITSYDFKKSWEQILTPDFPSNCSYLLFPILNAEEIKKGKKSINSLGVNCIDEKTLVIKLTHPTPHFLSLTSLYIYAPFPSHLIDISDSNPKKFICNGPFKLKKWIKSKKIELEKNPFYWNQKKIFFDSININIIEDENKNLELFKNEKLDWINSLISPIAIPQLSKSKYTFHTKDIGGSTFCAFNTENFPFNSKNIRKAFSYAINRKNIIKKLYLNKKQLATRYIPPITCKNKNLNLIKDNDPIKAKIFFKKGLQELKIKPKNLNVILTFDNIYQKLADLLKNAWEKIFNIKIALNPLNAKDATIKIHKKHFQIAITMWSLFYDNPLNILERFKYKNYEKNYSNWENEKYISLLNDFSTKKTQKEREKILEKAEKLLLEESPLFPIYHHNYLILKNEKTKKISSGSLGEIIF